MIYITALKLDFLYLNIFYLNHYYYFLSELCICKVFFKSVKTYLRTYYLKNNI